MPSPNLWSKTVPTVELDQRSREARLRFESIERLLIPRAGMKHSGIRRFRLFLMSAFPTTRRNKFAFNR
jgi:hypothetical protein